GAGNPSLHADLCHGAGNRLERTRDGTARTQSPHPPAGALHRPGAEAGHCPRGSPLSAFSPLPRVAGERVERPCTPPGSIIMRLSLSFTALVGLRLLSRADQPAAVQVRQTEAFVEIITDALQARINKKGYVSGIAAGSLLDKKTGARDVG